MCYLCLKNDQFVVRPISQREKKLARAAELKKLLRAIDDATDLTCDHGDAVVDALRNEQYMLAREL